MTDVLLVCSNPAHLDALGAMTAASRMSAQVSTEPDLVALAWNRATVVVVGSEHLPELAAARPPRRENVVVFGNATEIDWQAAFELGAEAVVEPPGEPGWLADRVRRVGPASVNGTVVGVLGARGGAGASVFACALAVAAVRAGHDPYLLDLDPLGCGAAVTLGADRVEGLTWDQVSGGAGRIPPTALQNSVGRLSGVAVIGWPDSPVDGLPEGVAGAVVDSARLCAALTVVDLGRATSHFQAEALARCDRVLLVVPADVRSVQSARRLIARLATVALEVVVRGPNPGGLVVADIAAALGRPVLAGVGAEPGLDVRLERGEAPGSRARSPLGKAGTGIVAELLSP